MKPNETHARAFLALIILGIGTVGLYSNGFSDVAGQTSSRQFDAVL